MSCHELLRRLTEYEDGALGPDVCRMLEAHMETCPPCAELRREFLQLQALCRQSHRATMPDGLRTRLQALLRHKD